MIFVEHIIIKTSIPLQDETVHFKLHNVGVLYLSIQNTLSFFYYQTTSMQYVKKTIFMLKNPERNGRLEITHSFIYP